MSSFELQAAFIPSGDQPRAIEHLTTGLHNHRQHQILLGATGTGKTYTIANVIQQVQRPTLVLAHNKTLAAQLYQEYKAFFPNNAVEYYVSYYDYYQPEAYIPRTDTYIEKDTSINQELERMRMSAMASLLSRRDVIVVASVSAIFALADPETYSQAHLKLQTEEIRNRNKILRHLIAIHYQRNDLDLKPGTFRVRGDTLEIRPAYNERVYRISFFGDTLERIAEVDGLTGERIQLLDTLTLYPARPFVTADEKLNQALIDIETEMETRVAHFKAQDQLLEAQRLAQRTRYDMEMLRETGMCAGIENYSRHLAQSQAGATPWTLIDYFPDDFLLVVDESHMAVPQIRGMYHGDRARKTVLVDYGFRLPSALDNRPLTFEEWEKQIYQVIYTSATPGPYERAHAQQTVEQIIRPTGLLDPEIDIRPITGQIDDLLHEVRASIKRQQRVIITTLTKRMAEDLTDYLMDLGIKVQYLHSDIDTLDRTVILRDLRLGIYDVLVGINLLREGIDLPEVSLVAILDADKAGFLRSESALVQVIGRAARHAEGRAIMYSDRTTDAMQYAIAETNRRRQLQMAYNQVHNITPRSISKAVPEMMEKPKPGAEQPTPIDDTALVDPETLPQIIEDLEAEMQAAARRLAFEEAAQLRDQITVLQQQLEIA